MSASPTFGEKVKWFFKLEPALVRGLLIAVVAVVAQFGFDLDGWVDIALNIFSAISALLAVWWARGVVVPTAKVLAFKPKPVTDPAVIEPGAAVATTQAQVEDTVEAARSAA